MVDGVKSEYPDYATSELVTDGVVHLAGIAAALVAISAFLSGHFSALDGWTFASLVIYWIGLLAMLSISFCYHMTPWERFRPHLRRYDHATIYLKIAGTYTPFVAVIGGAWGYGLLAIVWALALFGAGRKLFHWESPGRMGVFLYLGLGWISVLLIWSIFLTSQPAAWCVVIGGLLYTAGTIFFHWESLKFANAIWHGFVVVASGFLFAGVWLISMPMV